MVFFNCNACGEALKKNQVEKHYLSKCRQCTVLSCVDCGKDFWGDDYQKHIKCISEEEKYSGKDWKPKANFNKGEAKQEAWIQQVQSAIEKSSVNPKLQGVLRQLKEYSNIPRKKAKFLNFVQNSMRVRDTRLVNDVWDILEQEMQIFAKQQAEKTEAATEAKMNGEAQTNNHCQNDNNQSEQVQAETEDTKKLSKRERKEERRKQKNKVEKKDRRKQNEEEEEEVMNGKKHKRKRKRDEDEEDVAEDGRSKANTVAHDDQGPPSKKKKKKHKRQKNADESADEVQTAVEGGEAMHDDGTCEEEAEAENESQNKVKFSWEAAIIGALKAASDKELSVKKLRKKVLAEFNARGGDGKTKSEEKLWAKFEKKIHKNPRLKVHKDKVKLNH